MKRLLEVSRKSGSFQDGLLLELCASLATGMRNAVVFLIAGGKFDELDSMPVPSAVAAIAASFRLHVVARQLL